MIYKKYGNRQDKYFWSKIDLEKKLGNNTNQVDVHETKSLIFVTKKIINQFFVLGTNYSKDTFMLIFIYLITKK